MKFLEIIFVVFHESDLRKCDKLDSLAVHAKCAQQLNDGQIPIQLDSIETID